MSIYSVSISNYSSNQDTQNPVVETLAADYGTIEALPSNTTSSGKGGNVADRSNSGLSNQSGPTGTSQEPTMLNQTSKIGNSLGNQSATTASSS